MAGKFEIEISKAGTFNKAGSTTGWPVNGLMLAGKVIGGSGVDVCVGGVEVGMGVEVDVAMLELQADKRISKSKANFFMTKL